MQSLYSTEVRLKHKLKSNDTILTKIGKNSTQTDYKIPHILRYIFRQTIHMTKPCKQCRLAHEHSDTTSVYYLGTVFCTTTYEQEIETVASQFLALM